MADILLRDLGVLRGSKLSPDSHRGFLPGFAYQRGNLRASYIVVFETGLAVHCGYTSTLAVSAIVIFMGAAVVTGLGREKRAVEFGVVVLV